MIQISFKPSFVRGMNKLEKNLIDEVLYKIDILKNSPKNPELKIHKLHGRLKDCWSFSVNYKIRVVFEYESKNEIVLLAIGDHSVYN
ncbi:MAG: type II toxin-antitoxin system mRNA interferase toxin, RelE/StbE family [bacterium]|nr:type II toxin-antitoxin system mRNA interferase toxin, RelE/StbE family [bacterium]